MGYVQRKFYLPEDTYAKLTWLAESEKKTISDLLRELINDGLKRKKKKNSMRALLDLAREARTEGWKGPKDWSAQHDRYFQGAAKQGK